MANEQYILLLDVCERTSQLILLHLQDGYRRRIKISTFEWNFVELVLKMHVGVFVGRLAPIVLVRLGDIYSIK